jgi:hypothetical protein
MGINGDLVGGLEHVYFSIQLGISSSQLTFTPSFFRGEGQPPTRLWYIPVNPMKDQKSIPIFSPTFKSIKSHHNNVLLEKLPLLVINP